MYDTTMAPKIATIDFLLFLLTALSACCISLKLSLCYFVLVPLAVLGTWRDWTLFKKELTLKSPIGLFFLFCGIAALCALYGENPARSIRKLTTFTLSGTLLFTTKMFLRRYRGHCLLISLGVGQLLASGFAIGSKLILGFTPEVFHGAVTHSGQLTLLVPLFWGVSLGATKDPASALGNRLYRTLPWKVLLLVSTLALVTNLKRGPWFGATIALVFILIKTRPKVALPVLMSVCLAILAFPSLRTRAGSAQEDFFIAGGRNTMWHVGAELSQLYPIGIGFGNSRILRDFSAEIPEQHKHFHNNVLNLVVETGWIATAIFVYWIAWLIVALTRLPGACATYGASIMAWQLAGISEYNIGDTEIMVLACIIIGMGLSRIERNTSPVISGNIRASQAVSARKYRHSNDAPPHANSPQPIATP